MTKQRQTQPINGWMASSQDTLVPYPLPSSSFPAGPRRGRRRKPISDPLPAMTTTLTPRSVPNDIHARPQQSVPSPRSMPAMLSPRTMATASQQLQDLTHEQYQERRRPRQILFFRNGDPFFKGKKMLITPHRYTSFEDLLSELTRNMKLPYGVRQIFTPAGSKVRDIEELKDGESYICASFERLKRMKYGSPNNLPSWNTSTRRKEQNNEAYLYAHVPVGFSYPSSGKYAETYNKSTFGSGHSGPGSFAYNRTHPGASLGTESKAFGILHSDQSPIKPKVVKIVKTGARPRKVVSLLINKRSVQSYEQLIQDVSDAFNLPKYKNNRIRKLYTLKGKEVKSLVDFYRDKDGVFVASSSRSSLAEDTFVDIYEEVFPDSPYEQFFHKKKGKKRDNSKHDSGISDDEDKVLKNKQARNKPKDGDSRLEDSRGSSKTDAISHPKGSKDDTKKKEKEEKENERTKELEEKRHEEIKRKESELLEREEKLRLREEELQMKEQSENDRKDTERQEELARKEAELKQKEEKLQRREDEERQKMQELLEVNAQRKTEETKLLAQAKSEREAREAAEKKAAEESAMREKAEEEARNEREQRLIEEEALKEKEEAERKARLEAESLDQEHQAKENEKAELLRVEEPQSRMSLELSEEGQSVADEVILYSEGKEDPEQEDRLAQLEADLQEEVDRRAKERHTGVNGLDSLPRDSDEIIYKKIEDEAPSPDEPVVKFVRQPRTLVKKTDILVKYDIEAKIGDGNFADVHEAVKKDTQEFVAMKIIEKAKLKNKEHMVENEIAIMKHVRHPNIVRLYEEFETRGYIYLVMEYVTGGDLFDAITESVKFTEADAALMVKDLASALAYLHNLNVVHRDLKPENLLVNKSDEGDITLKLADFGLAMEVKEPIFTVCGTPTYVAPEILAETGYGLEVDMWALGVITYILLCGFPPFRSPDRDQEELFELIQAGEFSYVSPYWDNISSAAKDLIDHLLVVDKEKRYTAKQVLRHPWVANGGTVGTLANLQREVSMNLEKNFAGRRSARRSARRKAGATQK